jgi:uncharacterized protein
VSRYVTRVMLEEVDTLLLYGGLAGRLVEVTGSTRDCAEALLKDPNSDIPGLREAKQVLIDQGILVPDSWDERSLLEARRELAHDPNVGSMSLTICPTVNCNFRCTYCYQHHVGKLMSADVQDSLIGFLRRQQPPVSSLFVTWFGGEPLLGFDVIERLTPRLRTLAPDAYSAHIITNGSLLTREISARLVDLGVESAQVTLDGPRTRHNERRPLAGGQSTFDRILENLCAADRRLRFSVRVNTDRRNSEEVTELFDQLDAAGLRGRVQVYFAPVTAYTDVCADTAGHCLAGNEWSQLNMRLRLAAMDRGYGSVALPVSRTGMCIADDPRGWVVTPEGRLFKCWNDVTAPERAVYDIVTDEQTPRMQAELERWTSWSPFRLTDCVDCKTLPQCHSGCAHIAMQREGPLTHGDCSELKWSLPETIAMYYLAHAREQAMRRYIPLQPIA